VVAIDSRRPRDGRALEILGFYDPLTDPATVQIDAEKLNAWIGKGARPSDTVVKLMRQASIPVPAGYEPVVTKPSAKDAPKPPKRARAQKAAPEVHAEPAADAATEAPAEGTGEAAPAETREADPAAAESAAEEVAADEGSEGSEEEAQG
jgi:small subunit ribosomal protein S16